MLSQKIVLSAQFLLLLLAPSIPAKPLQLSLPTLINSALSNFTTSSTVHTSVTNEPDCFEPRPDRLAIKSGDCQTAAMEMHSTTDAKMYIFGRGSDATYKLPRYFQSGTCMLSLDMVYSDQTDRLTFARVRQLALALASQCATVPVLNVGGIAAVEPRDVLYILIQGIVPQSIS